MHEHPLLLLNLVADFRCASGTAIDILCTLDSASIYTVIPHAIQRLKPWLQSQVVPMKWEDPYIFYFLNREHKHLDKPIPNTFLNYSHDESYCCFEVFISEWELPIWPPSIQMGETAGIFLASILLKEMHYI